MEKERMLVSFAAIVWGRHATLPSNGCGGDLLGEGALRDNPKQRLRRRLRECAAVLKCLSVRS